MSAAPRRDTSLLGGHWSVAGYSLPWPSREGEHPPEELGRKAVNFMFLRTALFLAAMLRFAAVLGCLGLAGEVLPSLDRAATSAAFAAPDLRPRARQLAVAACPS